MTYTNPVLPGFHPDPSVCRVGDDYYLVTSSFEYFPGVPLFHSRDLVNWTAIGHVLTRPRQLKLAGCGPSGGVYAPTLRHHRGRFFMITTNVSDLGNFLVWTDDIRGEWSDPVKVDAPGIDPSLLFDEDGNVYYTGNGADSEPPGIYGFEIDVATGRQVGPRNRLWEGTGGAYPEGPHLYHIGPWYYLMISEGGTEHGHMLTIARSPAPMGPFESCPHNPILTSRSLRTPVKAVGHADLVEGSDGRWWAVCLAIRPQGYPEYHFLGRETFLAPVVWKDGWPIVGNAGSLALEMTVPGVGPALVPKTYPRDDFDAPHLGLDWCFLRMPSPGVSLAERPGFLTLRGLAVGLDDQDTPALVCRRVEHLHASVRASIEFDPGEGDEAGLVILMNHRHHYEAALTKVNGARSLIFRRRIGSLWKVEATVPCAPGPVVLGMKITPGTFPFTYQTAGGTVEALGEGEARYLSTEVGGAFTGTMVGVYAAGRGKPCAGPAFVDWFEYAPGP